MVTRSPGREWRQFRLLARDSVRRILIAAVLSREADPWQFAIWATALIQTPPTLYGLSQMFKYAVLRHASPAIIERVVLVDRMFFVIYAMVAAALLASMTWEGLFPDRTDQEIVGALPVRPRTLAAARLTGAIVMGCAFSVAINLPSAVFFSLIAATHPLLGHVYSVFAGHLLGTVAGAMTVFLSLLVVRGVTAGVLNAGAGNAVAAVLQLGSVSGVIEAFLYVPSILPRFVNALLAGDPATLRLPPIWFTAIYTVVAGRATPMLWTLAARGALVLAVLVPLAIVVYLVPAAWMARRTLESSSKQRAQLAAAITRATAGVVAYVPRVRAIVMFAIASFTRNRRHVIVVIGQLGVGLALAAVKIVADVLRHGLDPHAPAGDLLSLPLVIMFFAVLGLRSAFTIPTELEANWPFRIVSAGVAAAASATRRAMLALMVVPVTVVAIAIAIALGWHAAMAILAGGLDLLAGVLLVECAAFGWHAVPFAREHSPSSQSLKWRGLVMVLPLYVFAFVNARAQMAALQSPRAAAWYVFTIAAAAIAVHRLSVRESERQGLSFDDDQDSPAVLNLSNAI